MTPLAIIAFLVTFTGAGNIIAVALSRLIAEQVAAKLERNNHK